MPLARRHFTLPGKSDAEAIEWLEARLTEVEEEQAAGKSLDSWSAGDSSAHKMLDRNLDARTRRRMLLNDLSLLDPVNYDARDHAAITMTVPRYL